MRAFKTLQELIDYIPKCVICQKEMKLSIEGYLAPIDPRKPRWGSGSERVYFKLQYKDGILRSKHKNHSLSIEAATNKLIDGEDMINRLMINSIHAKKCCPTCAFKSYSVYQAGNTKKTHHFPPMMLQSEELSYTLKGGKRVNIMKHHNFSDKDEEAKCYINYNGTMLPPIALDFNKLSDLEQINRKIKTIVTFQ
jgi:hypothetical protein